MASKIKKGDTVIVTTGKHKGQTGNISAVLADRGNGQRVLISGLSMVHRHTKQSAKQEACILSKEASLHISNVAIRDPNTNKPAKVGFKKLADGRKVRCFKASGEVIDD